MKLLIKKLARRFGVNLGSTDQLGVQVEHDLARLAAAVPLKTIFDVGANHGQSALRFIDCFPESRVHSFEPVPATYRSLSARVSGIDRIRAYNLALGEEKGSVAMSVREEDTANSILQSGPAGQTVEVQVDTVDDFAESQGVDRIDLLKIDVEGYELQVLKGARKLLESGGIRFVYAECVLSPDDIFPHTSFFDIDQVLGGFGFNFVAYYGESFRLADGCALGNCLYALRSALPGSAPFRFHRNIV